MDQMSGNLFDCVVFLFVSPILMFVLFDVILVDFDELTIPVFGIDGVDNHKYFGAELVVGTFFAFQWYFEVTYLPFGEDVDSLDLLQFLVEFKIFLFLWLKLLI